MAGGGCDPHPFILHGCGLKWWCKTNCYVIAVLELNGNGRLFGASDVTWALLVGVNGKNLGWGQESTHITLLQLL